MPKKMTEPMLVRTERRLTNIEGENITQLDRIRAFYYQTGNKIQLSEKDEQYRRALESANQLMSNSAEYLSRERVAKVLMKVTEFGLSKYLAYKAIDDSIALYGDLFAANKAGYRNIMTQRYMRLAEVAESKGELELAARMYDRISKLNRLDQDELQASRRTRRVKVTYTTNPKALKTIEAEEIHEQ